MRATLWLFAYGGLTASTHVSVVQELVAWPELIHRVKDGDADQYRARSKVASLFLADKEAGDVLLMVDRDHGWEAGGLKHIAEQAMEHRAVVGGIYPKREFGQGAVVRLIQDVPAGDYRIGEDHLLEAEFTGTGFVAIHRAVLEAVAEKLPVVVGDFQPFFLPFVFESGLGTEYPNNDHAFCKRVREAGFSVYASTYPVVTHEGRYIYRMVDSEITPPVDKRVVFHLGEKVHA